MTTLLAAGGREAVSLLSVLRWRFLLWRVRQAMREADELEARAHARRLLAREWIGRLEAMAVVRGMNSGRRSAAVG